MQVVRAHVWARVGDEIIVLNVSRGRYYGLNGVAAAIWEMLQEPIELPAVLELLEERYASIPSVGIRRQVEEFLGELLELGLIDATAAERTPAVLASGGMADAK